MNTRSRAAAAAKSSKPKAVPVNNAEEMEVDAVKTEAGEKGADVDEKGADIDDKKVEINEAKMEVDEDPVSANKPVSPMKDKPNLSSGSPAKEKLGSPAKEKLGSPAKEKLGSPAKEKLGSPTKEKLGSPTKEKLGSPTKEKLGSPTKEKLGSPTKEKLGSPTKEKLGSPTKEKLGSPTKEKLGSPTKEKLGSPTKEKSSSKSGPKKNNVTKKGAKSNPKSQKKNEPVVRRNPDELPCGLDNFGNFCYVNSFLQIWFNDLVFRQSIYQWSPFEGWNKPEDTKLNIQTVMGSLQRLFITMQITPFNTTDAMKFIKALNLDKDQHDIQEFSTLFFDAVDKNSTVHPNGDFTRNVIKSRYQGQMTEISVCGNCGKHGSRVEETRYLQIAIEGRKYLGDAIKHHFTPERVEDFKCDKCNVVGYTVRFPNYTQLPPVLIIQLNRYTYDEEDGESKVESPLFYPRTLEEKLLHFDTRKNRIYELCGVMIHKGDTTGAGHYYDIIKKPGSDKWYKYNDHKVEEMKKPPGYSDDSGPLRTTVDAKGVYTLIYRLEDDNDTPDSFRHVSPPPALLDEISTQLETKFSDPNAAKKNAKNEDSEDDSDDNDEKTSSDQSDHSAGFRRTNLH